MSLFTLELGSSRSETCSQTIEAASLAMTTLDANDLSKFFISGGTGGIKAAFGILCAFEAISYMYGAYEPPIFVEPCSFYMRAAMLKNRCIRAYIFYYILHLFSYKRSKEWRNQFNCFLFSPSITWLLNFLLFVLSPCNAYFTNASG